MGGFVGAQSLSLIVLFLVFGLSFGLSPGLSRQPLRT